MAEFFELVITFLGWFIYGTDDKPRHPFWRNTVRLVAFGGAAVLLIYILGFLDDSKIPMGAIALWFLCAMIVLSAEYYLGSMKIAYAAIATSIVLSLLAVSQLL